MNLEQNYIKFEKSLESPSDSFSFSFGAILKKEIIDTINEMGLIQRLEKLESYIKNNTLKNSQGKAASNYALLSENFEERLKSALSIQSKINLPPFNQKIFKNYFPSNQRISKKN